MPRRGGRETALTRLILTSFLLDSSENEPKETELFGLAAQIRRVTGVVAEFARQVKSGALN